MRQTAHKTFLDLCRAFARDRSGVTAIEYAIIASGLSVVIVGSVNAIGGSLSGTFTSTNGSLGGG